MLNAYIKVIFILRMKLWMYIHTGVGMIPPVTITTRIITCLAGDPYQSSLSTVGGGSPSCISIQEKRNTCTYVCIFLWYALNMHILYILRMFITTLQRQCIAFSFTLRSSGKSQRAFLEGIMWTTYRSRVILQNMIHVFKSPSVWKKLVSNTIIEAFFQNRLRSI